MTDSEQRNLVAQWAFDTRPVLSRFHLWLDDVEVERAQPEPVSAHAFTPRGVARCMAMTAAVTALGTRLFGQYGEGQGKDKQAYNQVKKAADAISAYIMSEGLWVLTRALPENHAVMVCLGEGLMPKAGETPEMGANPLLGFGRVYARPTVARAVDEAARRLLNDPAPRWSDFYDGLKRQGITVWGAAVDTLENTSRFAEGRATGPMSVLHLFDSPLTVTRPYEAYFGCLTVPRQVAQAAERRSLLLDWVTPRKTVLELIGECWPGIRPGNVHVWTLGGKSRQKRLGHLWDEWRALGVHLVEDGWTTPHGLAAFNDSGTYAPTFMVKSWIDASGVPHVFLVDGYAATAEAMQAASLSEVLEVDATMTVLSSTFELPHDDEYRVMREGPGPEFAATLARVGGGDWTTPGRVAEYTAAVKDARLANVPLDKRSLRADDFLPEKHWKVLACAGYMCDDPYTGASGVEDLGGGRYRVTTRLATRKASSRIAFTFRMKESRDQAWLVFSPLLVRYMNGTDWKTRPVKVSDSGRLRNELQTLMSQALVYDGDRVQVHFERVDPRVLPLEKQAVIREVLAWYKQNHPVWFEWLEVAPRA